MYQLFLSLHITAAILVWLASFYGIAQLTINRRAIKQETLLASLLTATVTGLVLGINSGSALIAVCLKLGLYLSPSLLYLLMKYFSKNTVNAK